MRKMAGYYDPDTETWATEAEMLQRYEEEQELIAIEADIRRQRAAEDHAAGIVTTMDWFAFAASTARALGAVRRPLAEVPVDDAPVVVVRDVVAPGVVAASGSDDGLLAPEDCRAIADALDALRWDPDHTPEGHATRDDYRRWSRRLRAYATTLTSVQTARALPVRRTA